MGADARWTGAVVLRGDVLVPAGRRLVVAAGADVSCASEPARSTPPPRPAFAGLVHGGLRPSARLIVEGELVVSGSAEAPARFGGEFWGGIWAAGRGRIALRHAALAGMERAVVAVDFARAVVSDCSISGNDAGAAIGGCARALFRRCRFERSGEIGALAADDANVLLSFCGLESSLTGAAAEGCARLRLRGCSARGCAGSGLRASGASSVSARESRFNDCAVAAAAQGRSELKLASCRATGGRTAWEAFGDARLDLRRCEGFGQETGLWVQDRAAAVCDEGRFEGGWFGLRASHRSRLTARATQTEVLVAALVEGDAFASFRGCEGVAARGGPDLLGRAAADVDGVRFRPPFMK
ncbi:MAG TPA: right-handed parallel beta-helix repeat-containing protein [Elusimicrobiota bacterium]|nr:right-handed parallel beta-helix repeat-containing protein [Elusimicrobiota bacterium]